MQFEKQFLKSLHETEIKTAYKIWQMAKRKTESFDTGQIT